MGLYDNDDTPVGVAAIELDENAATRLLRQGTDFIRSIDQVVPGRGWQWLHELNPIP